MHRMLFGSFLLACASVVNAAPGNVAVHLDAPTSTADIGSGTLVFSMANESAATVHVLRWQTPFDGITTDLFRVERDGVEVAYTGPLYKRGVPQAKDYLELAPGASRTIEVDLSAYYDMKLGGQYSIVYARDADSVLREAARAAKAGIAATAAIDSDSATLWVDGSPDAFDSADEAPPGPFAAINSFVGCSNTRKTQLVTARKSALAYATNSRSYLDAGTHGSRYTWWFGSHTSSRHSRVRTHFTNIGTALSGQPYTFDCSCTEGDTYAYVYPTRPYRVYLCGAFWSAPNTGTDSRAGTLVHETSHFNVVAGTDDWAYGQSAAHSLANSNPGRAVDNADNHEYFAENTPVRN